MTIIRLKFASLKQSRWYEHVIRFVLGGLATMFAGAVAKLAGPSWGGLFLAFPAIFCASSTLIEKHERRRKESKRLQGARRGQEAAALDAFGAALGSVGMMAFALTVWLGRLLPPVVVLGLAMAMWGIISVAAWQLGRRCLRAVGR
ncbi:hypothetical protein AFEL58S_02597 [Afipia felis]